MKKLIIAIVILFIILIGIGACTMFSIGNAVEEAAEEISTNIDNLENCEVTIDKCEVITIDEKPYAIVSFTFTNNSNENRAFYTTVEALAFQDGVEAAESIYLLNENLEPVVDDNYSKEIKPGASINVEYIYALNDIVTPLEIEISHWLFESKPVTKIFELK